MAVATPRTTAFPHMASTGDRAATFVAARWGAQLPPAQRMANAGWFLPVGDVCPRCYVCGATLANTSYVTDPITAHPAMAPACVLPRERRLPLRLLT